MKLARPIRCAVVIAALLLTGAASALLRTGLGPEEFIRRREALAGRLEGGILVLRDEPISRESVADVDRNTRKYDFWYLTGWEKEGSILLLDVATKASVLFVPGSIGQAKGAAKKAGLDDVLPLRTFPKTLRSWAAKAEPIVWTKRASSGPEAAWSAEIGKILPAARIREVRDHFGPLRVIKSEAEIEVMREVAQVGAKGLVKVIPRICPGMRESDAAAVIEKLYRKGGAQRRSFPPIIGSGRNGTIIHYTKNASVMKAGDLVVMDVGAELDHYASDITRTVPVLERFTERQKEVYQAVLDAQIAAEEKLKPGATFGELQEAAESVLRGRGFPRIPHGVSHFVGLAVHDSGISAALEPGMVITIEPGVYLRKEGIGIRIEDMYLVTKTGFERLSSSVPRTIEEIEALKKTH